MTLIEIIKLKLDQLRAQETELSQKNDDEIAILTAKRKKAEELVRHLSSGRLKAYDDKARSEIGALFDLSDDEIFDFSDICIAADLKEKGLIDSLTPNQVAIVNTFIEKLNGIALELRESILDLEGQDEGREASIAKAREDITAFSNFIEKLNNGKEILDEEDLKTLNRLVIGDNSLSYEDKRQALIDFRHYNDSTGKKLAAKRSSQSIGNKQPVITPPTIDVPVKKEVSFEDVQSLFADDEGLLKYASKFKDEVLQNIDLNNARAILDFIKENNLESRFNQKGTLLAVLVYGNRASVEEQYKRMSDDKDAGNLNDFYYRMLFDIPSVWVPNQGKDIAAGKVLGASVHGISYSDFIKNVLIFEKIKVDGKLGLKSLIQKSPTSILEKIQALSLYGYFNSPEKRENFPLSLFKLRSGIKIADESDKLIEIGLLGAAHVSPSALGWLTDDHFVVASELMSRKNNPNEFTNGETFTVAFRNKFSTTGIGEKFVSTKKFLDFSSDEVPSEHRNDIPNRELYSAIIDQAKPLQISEDVLEREEIKALETTKSDKCFKADDYRYRIGDRYISRLKVLRCYGAILDYSKQNGIEVGSDALLYCIVRGTYLSEDQYKGIKEAVDSIGKSEKDLAPSSSSNDDLEIIDFNEPESNLDGKGTK